MKPILEDFALWTTSPDDMSEFDLARHHVWLGQQWMIAIERGKPQHQVDNFRRDMDMANAIGVAKVGQEKWDAMNDMLHHLSHDDWVASRIAAKEESADEKSGT